MKNPIFLMCLLCLLVLQGQSQGRRKIDYSKNAPVQYGIASYYSDKFEGKPTSTGEKFSQKKLTAAHNSLPLGTWVKITNLRNKKTVIVRINDRLHHRNTRLVDLSRTAASQLGYISRGLTRVKVEVLGKKKPVEAAADKSAKKGEK